MNQPKYGFLGMELDPVQEAEDALFYAVRERNVDAVRQCLAQGTPVEATVERSYRQEGNLKKAIEVIQDNSPDDAGVQILGLLVEAQGDKPFQLPRLEMAVGLACDRGLSTALDTLLPLLPQTSRLRQTGVENLLKRAIRLSRNQETYPFARLPAAPMVTFLLNQGFPVGQHDEKQPLSLALGEGSSKSTLNSVVLSRFLECADVLIGHGAPVIDPNPRVTEHNIRVILEKASPVDSPYAHWLEHLAHQPDLADTLEALRPSIPPEQWAAYANVHLDKEWENPKPSLEHRKTLRM